MGGSAGSSNLNNGGGNRNSNTGGGNSNCHTGGGIPKDNRSPFIHGVHAGGHGINYMIKDSGMKGIETTGLYKSTYPNRPENWDK